MIITSLIKIIELLSGKGAAAVREVDAREA
jgi:hypothetical protein